MNEALKELLEKFKADRSNENLNELITEIVKCKVLVLVEIRKDNKTVPRVLQSGNGDVFFGVYTDKKQITVKEPSLASIEMPFLVANKAAINPTDNIKGIVINPFTDNIVLVRQLLERIEEVEQKKKEMFGADGKGVKLTDKQYNMFERTQFEMGYMPQKLFEEGQEFIDRLLADKETYIDEMFEDSYQEKRMYPFLPEDFSVMTMSLSEDLMVICIEMPDKDVQYGNAYSVYIAWNQSTKEARYFRIVQDKEPGKKLLEEVQAGKKVIRIGDAPVEGSELRTITDMIGYTQNPNE